MTNECNRWAELSDLRALGDDLSSEQVQFLSAHSAACPMCGAEQRIFDGLGACLVEEEPTAPGVLPNALFSRSPSESEGLSTTSRKNLLRRSWAASQSTVFSSTVFSSSVFSSAVFSGVLLAAAAAAVFMAVRVGFLQNQDADTSALESAEVTPPTKSFAQLLLVSGDVKMGGSQPSAGASLDEADTLVTRQGRACVTHGSSTTCLESHSQARILEARAGAQRMELFEGTLICRQSPSAKEEEFEVKTKYGTLVGVGASFVTAYSTEGVSLSLSEGRIRIVPSAGTERVISGRREVQLSSSGVLGESKPTNQAIDNRFREMETWDQASLTPVALGSQPSGATVRIDGVTRGTTPLSMMLNRGSHRVSLEKDGFSLLETGLEVKGAERVTKDLELVPTKSATSPSPVPAAGPSELLARAQALRKQGRYQDAALAYRSLLAKYPSSGEAAVTRLSLGELELSQLGAPAAALQSFRLYKESGGALRQEASYGEIRALRALGRQEEARRLAQKFVNTYPESGQAVSLGRWLGSSNAPSPK